MKVYWEKKRRKKKDRRDEGRACKLCGGKTRWLEGGYCETCLMIMEEWNET